MHLPVTVLRPIYVAFLGIFSFSCTDRVFSEVRPSDTNESSGSGNSGTGANGSGSTGSNTSTGVKGGGTSPSGSTSGSSSSKPGSSSSGSTGSSSSGSSGSGTTGSTSVTKPGGSTGSSSGSTGGNNPGTNTKPVSTEPTKFNVPSDAKPTPLTSGKSGAFRVNSNGKLTHNGAQFQVRGGNWFGLEGQDDILRPGAMELYIGSVFWASAGNQRTIKKTMEEITAAPLNLNTIRVPISPQTLAKGHPDGLYSRSDVKIRNNEPTLYPYTDALEALEDFLVQAAASNLYVILDMHSCSNHIGWRAGKIDDGPPWTDANRDNYKYKKENYTCKSGEDAYDVAKWLADIHTMAKLPKKLGIKNIIGIDCFNEPFKYTWSEWADLAKQCYDAIAAEDDDLIAIVEGVSGSHGESINSLEPEPFGDLDANPNWGENLYGQQFDPIQIPKDRLCFSPHTYGPSVYVQKQFIDNSNPACVGLEDDAAGKAKCKLVVERSNSQAVALIRKGWEQHFGYLADQKFCIIPGEFGGHKEWPANPVKPTAATIWAHLPKGVRYDWEWQNMLVDYLKEKGITDFTYWSINPESGDTAGLYNHAYTLTNEAGWGVWQGLDMEKAALLARLK